MIDETLSHYRITDELGRGGMGIVYRAEDTRLDRPVALKVLPPHALASADDRARFYREARAAARLSGGRALLQRPVNTEQTVNRIEVVTHWFAALEVAFE